MKVSLDITPVDSRPSGVGLYVCNLVAGLTTLNSCVDLQLILHDQLNPRNLINGQTREESLPTILRHYSQRNSIPIPVKLSNFLIKYWPKILASYLGVAHGGFDISHRTNYTVLPFSKSRNIITIYDLSFIKYPQYVHPQVEKSYTGRLQECLKWADAVITISESSKCDIAQYLDISLDRIFVTPLANRYRTFSPTENIKAPKILDIEKLGVDVSKPYLLFVSTIEPRKNIKSIIQAFNYLKQKQEIEHQLILIGQKGWRYEPIFEEINASPWRDEIHHLNYVSDELLEMFYRQADVFVYPSHYEGFGLPVLEAMAFGVPVVSASTSSIPEVAGDAALLVNPDDFMELAEAILRVISDRPLRQSLIERGKQQAKLFSWEKTAERTLDIYKKVLEF